MLASNRSRERNYRRSDGLAPPMRQSAPNGGGGCLVLGTAKSGTTALFTIVQRAFADMPTFFEQPIDSLGALPDGAVVKVIFEHEAQESIDRFAVAFRHRIMLLRDPRDSIVSRLLYSLAANPTALRDDDFLCDFLQALRCKQQRPSSVDMSQLLAMLDDVPNAAFDRMLAISQQLASFKSRTAESWCVIRYEAMVAGDLAALSTCIGRPVRADPVVDPAYSRVIRTKAAGDWRHWFTRRDIATYRDALDPVMRGLGYAGDWEPAETPVIRPEHSWAYVMRLIEERRRFFGFPPFLPKGFPSGRTAVANTPCNICGNTSFGPGPNGRLTASGQPPACLSCGSLERQRIVRAVMHMFPLGLLAGRRALAFGAGIGVQPSWFLTWQVCDIEGGDALEEGAANFILLDHVLEYVEDDRAAFDRITRLLSPDGIMLAVFAATEGRTVSEHATKARGAKPLWHRYGADLASYFGCEEKGLSMLRITSTDCCTGVAGELHLFCREAGALRRLQAHVETRDPSVVVQVASGRAGQASPSLRPRVQPCRMRRHSPVRVEASPLLLTGVAP